MIRKLWNRITSRFELWLLGTACTPTREPGALCWHCAEDAGDREQMFRLIHEGGRYECSKCGVATVTTFKPGKAVSIQLSASLLLAASLNAAAVNPWTLFPASSGTPSTLTNGLLFTYRMDESSGNLAPSAGSITMTNVGSMGFNTSGGVIGGAVSNATFAASSRYFWSAAKWYTGTITSMSIGFWCFSTNTVAGSTDGDMWGPSQYNSAGTATNVQFYTALRTALPGSARRAEVAITDRNTTTARKIYRTTNSLPANQPNLIVMTFSNNVLKLYTNGVEVTGAQLNKDQDNTVTTIGPVPDNASAIGTIQVTASGGVGAHNGKGAIDLPFGYDRVLTDAEVLELWNNGAGRDPSNP